MQNYYQFIIPRLNGKEIKEDFKHYLSLVKKGIAGFIVFGGEIEQIRENIKRLQDIAELPLIISSDLEQGLGQQIKGGTLFPPAMAVAAAIKKNSYELRVTSNAGAGQALPLLRKTYKAFAVEAKYAGINTILAPVLDINTNPKNPIISVRAFGEDSETVSFFGCEMIKTIQSYGIATCGKHFPGHGDTEVDSHIKLPTINRDLNNLRKHELQPFKKAIEAEVYPVRKFGRSFSKGVKMIMLGHLNVPAIDPSGIPVSISEKAVRFLREKMRYKGMLITDALDMGGIGRYSEEKAAFMALKAGVDIILHPTDPEKIASYLRRKNIVFNADRLKQFRKGLIRVPIAHPPDFDKHRRLSQELTEKAIKISGNFKIKGKPFLVILNDDEVEKGKVFAERLKRNLPGLKLQIVKRSSRIQKITFPDSAFVIIAIFSETKAWKGGVSNWLYNIISSLENKADLFVSFGSPYLLDNINYPTPTPLPQGEGARGRVKDVFLSKSITKMFVYWDSESAQEAAAKVIADEK